MSLTVRHVITILVVRSQHYLVSQQPNSGSKYLSENKIRAKSRPTPLGKAKASFLSALYANNANNNRTSVNGVAENVEEDEKGPSNVEYVSEQLNLNDASLGAFADVFARLLRDLQYVLAFYLFSFFFSVVVNPRLPVPGQI